MDPALSLDHLEDHDGRVVADRGVEGLGIVTRDEAHGARSQDLVGLASRPVGGRDSAATGAYDKQIQVPRHRESPIGCE